MNRLSKEQRTQIIAALVEDNSIRATARMCDVAFNTVGGWNQRSRLERIRDRGAFRIKLSHYPLSGWLGKPPHIVSP